MCIDNRIHNAKIWRQVLELLSQVRSDLADEEDLFCPAPTTFSPTLAGGLRNAATAAERGQKLFESALQHIADLVEKLATTDTKKLSEQRRRLIRGNLNFEVSNLYGRDSDSEEEEEEETEEDKAFRAPEGEVE